MILTSKKKKDKERVNISFTLKDQTHMKINAINNSGFDPDFKIVKQRRW